LVLNVIKNFIRDENGLEMVEWAIVAALIASVAVTGMSGLGSSIASRFDDFVILLGSLP